MRTEPTLPIAFEANSRLAFRPIQPYAMPTRRWNELVGSGVGAVMATVATKVKSLKLATPIVMLAAHGHSNSRLLDVPALLGSQPPAQQHHQLRSTPGWDAAVELGGLRLTVD